MPMRKIVTARHRYYELLRAGTKKRKEEESERKRVVGLMLEHASEKSVCYVSPSAKKVMLT